MADIGDPRASFGPTAENYVTSAVHNNPAALQRLIEIVSPVPGGQFLDIATGAGHAAHTFAPFASLMVASDLTSEMAVIARRDARGKGMSNVEAVLAKAESLPFGRQTFDGVLCRTAAHHFDSVPAFLSEVNRILRPGGWFLCVDNVGPEDRKAGEELDRIERIRDPSHATYLSVSNWKRLIAEAGFSIRHEEGSAKLIDMEDWLKRIGTPREKWPTIHNLIVNSNGDLRGYLCPKVANSSVNFNLLEHIFLSNK